MRPRYALARRRASELLQHAGVQQPPVPVEKLAANAGAALRLEPLPGELSGMVHRASEGRAIIGVNSLHAATRQRFTIAHELGHLLLHRDEMTHVDDKNPIAFRDRTSSSASDEREIEANQFAAELLMPTSMILTAVKDLPLGIEFDEGVRRLAEDFNVSVQAMTIRLSALGIVE